MVEDTAEGFGSRWNGQVLGTFGKYGVLSFNGNKMITTSGGGALITANEDEWREIMMYATQYRESYPYYQHEKIGYGIKVHGNPDSRYDSFFWLCSITLDENLKIKGQENAYKTIVTGAVGGAPV